jgi:hypothetical protein
MHLVTRALKHNQTITSKMSKSHCCPTQYHIPLSIVSKAVWKVQISQSRSKACPFWGGHPHVGGGSSPQTIIFPPVGAPTKLVNEFVFFFWSVIALCRYNYPIYQSLVN